MVASDPILGFLDPDLPIRYITFWSYDDKGSLHLSITIVKAFLADFGPKLAGSRDR